MYTFILDSVDATIGTFVIDMFTIISTELTPTLRLMMILTIIFYGLSIMQGWINTSVKEALRHILMALIVYIFATNVGLFTSTLYDLVTNAPGHLMASVLSAKTGMSEAKVNTFIGTAYTHGINAAGDLMFGSSIGAISLKLMGLLTGIATILIAGYSAFLVILSKIAVAILLGLSPIFIGFLMFKSTRGFFEGWLRQLLNFALIPILTYAVMIFCLSIMEIPLKNMNTARIAGTISIVEVMPYLIICIVSFLLLLQIMGIATGIAGGMTLSTLRAPTYFSQKALKAMSNVNIPNRKPRPITSTITNRSN